MGTMRGRSTASAFAEWVFEQQRPDYQSPSSSLKSNRLELGRFDHAEIDVVKKKSWFLDHSVGGGGGYRTHFVDDGVSVFFASNLIVDDSPVRCRPDLILTNDLAGHVIIIERKTTYQFRLLNDKENWDNAECQLWCYSYIDNLAFYDRVTLICERWVRRGTQLVALPSPMVWFKGTAEHERHCRRYFERYGGLLF
ncbi:hypothetical protein [Ancylobacter defluvii]|uniref:hypothetical protein n=1 Tax=Ancylobacter defluvii TaxID=1282440 RepID=UPI001BCABD6A|nr:hypothetical protein [Ancylobacter defluvii]MBS7587956.1 hypothetical protein [Ancylobacter defluvii]